MLKALGRVLAVLVAIGVVLAAWRYLGGGIGIGQPGWLHNAFDSITNFFGWSTKVVDDIHDKVPSTIKLPRPTGTIPLPKASDIVHPTTAVATTLTTPTTH